MRTVRVSPRSTRIVRAELIKAGSLGRVGRAFLSCLSIAEGLAQRNTQSKSRGLCYSAAGRGYDGKQGLSVQAEKQWLAQAEQRQLQTSL